MEASRALPPHLALRVGPASLALAAAGIGVAYALAAYWLGAAVMPLSLVAIGAVALGIWRLEWGLALFLIALPFAENIETANPEEAPLRSALILWLGVLVLVQLGRALAQRRPLAIPRMFWPVVGFTTAVALGVAVAPSAGGGAKFLTVAGAGLVFLLIALFLDDQRKLRPVLFALALSALVVSVHAIWQYETGQFGSAGFVTEGGDVEFRISSTFSSPNPLAGFLGITVPLGVGLYRFWQRRWMKAFASALVSLALLATVLTFSRGALVALAALPLIYLRDWRAWPLVGVALVAIILLAPSVWQSRVAGLTDTSSTEVATRLDFWEAALVDFGEHPVAGSGLDTFAEEYLDQERSARTFLGGSAGLSPPQTAHNLYLNTLAELGLIGGLALAAFVISALRLGLALRRSADPATAAIGFAVLGGMIVLFVHNLFDVTLLDPKNAIQAMALLGIGSAAWQVAHREGSQ